MQTFRKLVRILMCLVVLATGACNSFKSSRRETSVSEGSQLVSANPLRATLASVPIAYWFELKTGEYFTISLEKISTGLALSLTGPDGAIVRSVRCTQDGPFRISEVAKLPGR